MAPWQLAGLHVRVEKSKRSSSIVRRWVRVGTRSVLYNPHLKATPSLPPEFGDLTLRAPAPTRGEFLRPLAKKTQPIATALLGAMRQQKGHCRVAEFDWLALALRRAASFFRSIGELGPEPM